MNIQKKDLEKSQIELTVELSFDEFKPYISRGAEKISREIKIEGFRPGKIPYDILKQKIGEMTILEEAAYIAIDKTIEQAIKENTDSRPIGRPQINITKLAPGNPLEYKAVLSLLPRISLGDYKAAKVKRGAVEVKEDEINSLLDELRETRAQETLIDREIKDGDKAILNIEMFLDKVPVEGGQGKGVAVIIGKGYIMPGLDKKIIGAQKGESREFILPYSKEHYMANLAGKMVEFKVTVKEIYERCLPEANDAFAMRFGFKNVGEFKDNLKKSIAREKERQEDLKAETEMLDKIIAKTKFGEIPEVLIKDETKNMLAELEENIKKQKGNFDDYLAHLHKTRDQLILDLLPDAVKRIKISLAIREIASAEKIKVEDAEVEKEIEHILSHHQGDYEIKEKVNSYPYREYLRNLIAGGKVLEKLKEWNMKK